MQLLKQSTEIKVRIGPAVDATDGVTPETTLDLSTADQAELLKHNGAATVDISTNTFAAITGCDGWYDLTLTATDTDTLGMVTVVVQDSSLCLPIFTDFMVVTANVYDSLCSTDILQADITQIGGVAQSATDLKDFADSGYDPATHKVQGVVLTDTTTTNTDMRGTDNAALASVATETRLAELDAANIPTDLSTIDTVVDGIQTDLDNTTDGLGALKALIDTIDGIVDAILADTGTDGVVVAAGSKTGYALSDAGVDAIHDEVVEGSLTLRQMQRINHAVLAGKSTGGGTTTLTFRDIADTKARVTATVDVDGNRTAMTNDGT